LDVELGRECVPRIAVHDNQKMEATWELYEENRQRFWAALDKGVALIVGVEEKFRNADTELEIRQIGDFLYFSPVL
jgi:hypothetical protein